MPNFRSLVPGGFFSSDPNNLAIKRSIRTNNPGALNITAWQRAFPGFAGETQPDGAGNVTTIYVTPEHGIGAWYHLLTVRYGYGEQGRIRLGDLAVKYAGVNSESDAAARSYIKGWRKWSGNTIDKDTQFHLAADAEVLILGRAMFCHEIGGISPLHDDQILTALRLKRSGALPPH